MGLFTVLLSKETPVCLIISLLNYFAAADLIGRHETVTYKLNRHLLHNYEKHTRPVRNPAQSIHINISSSLYQIINVDQQKNLIRISAYFELWIDEYLRWDPWEYENTRFTYIPSAFLWTPELYLYYNVDERSTQVMQSGLDIQVHHTGSVRYFLPFTVNTMCPIDVRYFPFDKQTCSMLFGAWSHSTDSICYDPVSHHVNLNDFYDNQEWLLVMASLTNYTQYYVGPTGSNDSYSSVLITLHIQRQSFYYIFNLVLPSTLIATVALVGFHFPGSAKGVRQQKFRLGIMTLLSMAVLLLSVVTNLPKFSQQAVEGKRGSFSSVPLIGIYYFSLLFLITIGTFSTSLFVVWERYIYNHNPPVPWCLRWFASMPCILTPPKYLPVPTTDLSLQKQDILQSLRKSTSLAGLNQHHSGVRHGALNISLNNVGNLANYPSQYDNCSSVPSLHNVEPVRAVLPIEVLDAIMAMFEAVVDMRQVLAETHARTKVPENVLLWLHVLYRFELCSLGFYISMITLLLCMFFHHDWY